LRPNDHDQTLVQEADRLKANLSILLAIIDVHDGPHLKQARRIREIQAAMLQRLAAFLRHDYLID
jgi:hypothetical protein